MVDKGEAALEELLTELSDDADLELIDKCGEIDNSEILGEALEDLHGDGEEKKEDEVGETRSLYEGEWKMECLGDMVELLDGRGFTAEDGERSKGKCKGHPFA